jgi:hypothetical protein
MTEPLRRLPLTPTSATFEYVSHELANFLPMIDAAAFANLKADIAKNGLVDPIELFEGRILDGRNRYKACREIKYPFKPTDFKAFEGDYAKAEAYVISKNLQRRQMTNSQKQEFVCKMIEKYPTFSDRKLSREHCGGISHTTIGQVRERIKNPPERQKYEAFKKTWDQLPDDQREDFVKTFEVEIREMLPA